MGLWLLLYLACAGFVYLRTMTTAPTYEDFPEREEAEIIELNWRETRAA